MKKRPIIFRSEMVRAILDDRKTQVRRIVKPQPAWVGDPRIRFNPYHHGDRLWVREWYALAGDAIVYKADFTDDGARFMTQSLGAKWISPRLMTTALSRITLEITDVRLTRLQKISEEDAQAEGYPGTEIDGKYIPWSGLGWFMANWQSINGAASWDANPWVWTVEFKRL